MLVSRTQIIVLVTFALLPGLSCSKREESASVTESLSEMVPDQESWNSEIILTSVGKRMAVIKAGHMAKYKSNALVVMDEGVTVDFYDENENHSSVLTSMNGEVNERNHDLKATGSVVVVSDSGATLHTESLRWSNKLKKIISEVEVMITTEKDTLYGVGFESDAGLDNWSIMNPTGVTVRGAGN